MLESEENKCCMFVVPYVVLKLQVEMAFQNDVDAHCYELMMWGLWFLFLFHLSLVDSV
jgi:hypothetical protein